MLHMQYIFIVKLHFFCNVKKRTKLKMVEKKYTQISHQLWLDIERDQWFLLMGINIVEDVWVDDFFKLFFQFLMFQFKKVSPHEIVDCWLWIDAIWHIFIKISGKSVDAY